MAQGNPPTMPPTVRASAFLAGVYVTMLAVVAARSVLPPQLHFLFNTALVCMAMHEALPRVATVPLFFPAHYWMARLQTRTVLLRGGGLFAIFSATAIGSYLVSLLAAYPNHSEQLPELRAPSLLPCMLSLLFLYAHLGIGGLERLTSCPVHVQFMWYGELLLALGACARLLSVARAAPFFWPALGQAIWGAVSAGTVAWLALRRCTSATIWCGARVKVASWAACLAVACLYCACGVEAAERDAAVYALLPGGDLPTSAVNAAYLLLLAAVASAENATALRSWLQHIHVPLEHVQPHALQALSDDPAALHAWQPHAWQPHAWQAATVARLVSRARSSSVESARSDCTLSTLGCPRAPSGNEETSAAEISELAAAMSAEVSSLPSSDGVAPSSDSSDGVAPSGRPHRQQVVEDARAEGSEALSLQSRRISVDARAEGSEALAALQLALSRSEEARRELRTAYERERERRLAAERQVADVLIDLHSLLSLLREFWRSEESMARRPVDADELLERTARRVSDHELSDRLAVDAAAPAHGRHAAAVMSGVVPGAEDQPVQGIPVVEAASVW